MSTISASITAIGVTTGLLVIPGQTATYGLSGTYAATLVFERTNDGGQTWTEVTSSSTPNASVSGTVRDPGTYRWRCSSYTSGTAAVTIAGQAYPIGDQTLRDQAGNTIFGPTDRGVVERRTRRVVTLTDAATVTPNADTTDLGSLASVSQTTTIANPTGTPTDGQLLELRVTAALVKTINFDTQYLATAVALPTATAGSGQTERWLFEWNALTSKWAILSTNAGA